MIIGDALGRVVKKKGQVHGPHDLRGSKSHSFRKSKTHVPPWNQQAAEFAAARENLGGNIRKRSYAIHSNTLLEMPFAQNVGKVERSLKNLSRENP